MGMPGTLVFSQAGVSSTGQERGQNRPGRGMGQGSGAENACSSSEGCGCPSCVREEFFLLYLNIKG